MRRKISVGDVFNTNDGCRCVVIEYRSSQSIDIIFNDAHKHKMTVRAQNLRTGCIKNPYHPSVFGVACVGVGPHPVSENRRDTNLYARWKAILQRCYSESWKSRYPTYRECTIAKEWLNFQNFADWVTSQVGYNEKDWQIDKDFLLEGNKHYGPDTCALIPQRVNKLMVGTNGSNGLPRGVSWHSRYGAYGATCRDGSNREVFLGRFKTAQEAFDAYKKFKEKVIRSAANEFMAILDPRVYDALMRYEVAP